MSCCGEEIRNPDSKSKASNESPQRRVSSDLIALIVAGFIAGNSTLATLVVNLSDMTPQTRFVFQIGLLISTLLVAALLAPQLTRNILANAKRRTLSVDMLFVLGCVGAMGFSLLAFFRGTGPVYFEVFSILLVIYCLGSWVKRRTQHKVWTSLDAWSPTKHWCIIVDAQGNLQKRVVADVQPGDLVQVPNGAMIPVDGVVRQGEAFVREAAITGEPHVRSVYAGDRVFASSVVVDAPLLIEAETLGSDRLIDRVTSVVEAAQNAPSRWQTQADRMARWFTPFVVIVTTLTFAGWLLAVDVATALMISLSVLLVACPCAFGFATPVSIWVTLSRLASRSMVVRRADVIERLAAIDTVVFDKTGTLTVLKPELSQLIVRDGHELHFTAEQILGLARSIEAHSHHPIASVFLVSTESIYPTLKTESIPAVGVRGTVRMNEANHEIEVGRLSDLNRPCCDKDFLDQIHELQEPGQQAIAIRVNGELVAAALIQETMIDTLDEGLTQIRALGVKVKVFSGDRGNRIDRLGITDSIGGMTPDDKASEVQSLCDSGRRVLFIGDGVNDAVAMSHATASIAVADGSALATESSDIVWHGHDLRNIAAAITIARRSVSRLRRSLLFAITYNTIGMMIAVTGWLHPVVAVLLMMGSSLTVVLHAADMNLESQQVDEPLSLSRSDSVEVGIAVSDADSVNNPPKELIQISLLKSVAS